MMRSALAAMIITAFALASTAIASAEPMYLTYGTRIVTNHDWVGHTRGQLLKNMGTPYSVVSENNGGEILRFVKPMNIGRGNQIQIVEQFDVGSNGRITSASVYGM